MWFLLHALYTAMSYVLRNAQLIYLTDRAKYS